MRAHRTRFLAIALGAVAAALCATAISTLASPLHEGAGAVAEANTAVFGFVWSARDEPIPKAAVRLRNVTTGRAEAHAVTTETGEFTFDDIEGGTYVIEYVNDKGRVLAVGHVFSIAPGETVATFIRLTTGSSWFAMLLGAPSNIAATAVASAASIGVTALARPGRDVTAER